MITVTIFRSTQCYTGMECDGHAGFADAGKDIVCAAVSVLVINTINAIDQFTDDAFVLDTSADQGNMISFHFTENLSREADVLMKTLVLGLAEIQKQYGKSYLTLKFREV
jgi:hypothetical protein